MMSTLDAYYWVWFYIKFTARESLGSVTANMRRDQSSLNQSIKDTHEQEERSRPGFRGGSSCGCGSWSIKKQKKRVQINLASINQSRIHISRRRGADLVSGPAPAVAPDQFKDDCRSIYPQSINQGYTWAGGEEPTQFQDQLQLWLQGTRPRYLGNILFTYMSDVLILFLHWRVTKKSRSVRHIDNYDNFRGWLLVWL